MNLKQLAKQILPPVVVGAAAGRKDRRVTREFFRDGKIPWSPGYGEYKNEVIVRTLTDQKLLADFSEGRSLPPGYGVGVDERCIEYPWLLAKIPEGQGTLLDAGSALNEGYLLDTKKLSEKAVHIMTLAPESQCFHEKTVSYLFNDLRDIPVRDDFYDIVACISTLEHIGLDNTLYTRGEIDKEDRPNDFLLAVRELRRVLKSGGNLFLTIPFGRYEHFGTFQQFDQEMVAETIKAFGKASQVDKVFYRYLPDGWNLADPADCADSEYVKWVANPSSINKLSEAFPVEPDLAAAARAVACIHIVK